MGRKRKYFISRGELVICLMAMALLSSVVLYVKSALSGAAIAFHTILWVKTIIWMLWGLWIPVLFMLLRKVPIHSSNRYLGLVFHVPISIFIIGIHLLFYALIVKFSGIPNMAQQSIERLYLSFLFSQFEWYFMTYWALMLGGYASDYYQKFRTKEIESVKLDMLLTKAKLHALKMQLRPHFLFNTLNTISSLVRQDKKQHSISMLSELGDLLRLVLDQSEFQFIPLSKEIDFIEKYITLEKKRFQNKIAVKMDINNDLTDTLIPSFVLQPIIENSIYHGLSKKSDARLLSIYIDSIENHITIKIYNDGFPLADDFHITKTSGIGLANTIERLSRLYGEGRYCFDMFNVENGVMTALKIPYTS